MGARFAGSQRLGDRRRRRLAVESDDVPGATDVGMGLPGPTGNSRVGHGAHIDHPSGAGAHSLSLPISALVPSQWWKYLIGGTVCLAMAACLLFAGVSVAKWPHTAENGIVSLFGFPEAKIATWFSSLLLTVSSQLALLIWWVRSQSLNDFDGRYWLWIRVAALWMALSLGMATDAARVLEESFVHVCGERAVGYSFLSWLIPAGAGMWIVWSVAAEMRGCRWSRCLLWAGAVFHALAAGMCFKWHEAVALAHREVTFAAALLTGQVSIFLSMWIHARHVVHCTSEPAVSPNSAWRIPRPHFRFPAMRLPRPARRKKPAPTVEPGPTNRATPAAGKTASAVVSPAVERPSTEPPPVVPIELSDLPNEAPFTRPSHGDDAGSSRSATEDQLKPDLRGLSKKQRRRMQQEIRERERAAGR
jgi:hypothetical protein